MKRVFEGIVFERRRIGDNAIGACTTEAFEEFYQSLPIGKATRITAEDLPYKPEKNCGNCGRYTSFCCPTFNSPAENYTCWRSKQCDVPKEQPKPPEPQGWEQRFDKEYPHCGGAFKTSVKSFIRAEIERVREEEKQKVLKFLGWAKIPEEQSEIYFNAIVLDITQNKHRGDK